MIQTFQASRLAYVRGDSSSSWDTSGAFQGMYSGSAVRTGAMLFPTLLSVDWTKQIVVGIQLRMVFASAGGSHGKTIGLYRGTKKGGISGSGGSMRGAKIGDVYCSNAYNVTRTPTFNAGANAETFEALIAWLKSMSSDTLAIYVNEGLWSSHSYSYNYLKITSAALIIDYEPAGSDGKLSKTSVEAGTAVSLTITPPEGLEASALTHSVKWAFGSHSETYSIAAGTLSDSFTIPLSWLDAIPSASSGSASCELTTYQSGTSRGSKTLSFTVTVPASAAPTLSAAIAPAGQVTSGYYQYLSAAKVTASAAGKYGATITGYNISGSEGAMGSSSALTTAAFQTSGAHSYSVRVMDSRGKSAIQTVTCNVTAVSKPAIRTFKVERYSVVQGDTTSYVHTDYGTNVWITIDAGVDLAGGVNTGTAYIEYGKPGSTKTRVNLTLTNGAIQQTNNRSTITATISASETWEFTLYLSDKANSASAYQLLSRGTCLIDAHGSGWGVGIGGFVDDASESNKVFRSYWPSYFTENVRTQKHLTVGGNLAVTGSADGLIVRITPLTSGQSVSVPTGSYTTIDTISIAQAGVYFLQYMFEGAPAAATKVFQAEILMVHGGTQTGIAQDCGPTITGLYQKTLTTVIRLNPGDQIKFGILHHIGSAFNCTWRKSVHLLK